MSPTEFITRVSEGAAQYPLLAIAVAAVGGLLSTSVCPCTLPTGIALAGYVGGRTADVPAGRRRAAAISLAFFAGVLTSLTALGAAAAALGRVVLAGDAASSLGMAVLSMGVGLAALAGPWMRRTVPDPAVRRRGGISGAYAYGLLYSVATITSSAGPLMLVLTVAAAVGRPAYGAGLSLSFAIGRGIPFLLIGLFAGAAGAALARIERYRRAAEVVSGLALLALAGYFGWLAWVLR
ncbi:MAG: thiol:disulfide interchange protein [Gemmatimonadetes bacterium]|nr:thiol:disulfide interchange protein [Gemmatimonadota bacterium]